MNPAIVSRTVTGPGLKARPPMATYCEPQRQAVRRAKGAALSQREARERAEAMRLMASFGFEPQPPAPEMPARALHQEQRPDPEFSARYLSLLMAAALGAAAALLFDAGQP